MYQTRAFIAKKQSLVVRIRGTFEKPLFNVHDISCILGTGDEITGPRYLSIPEKNSHVVLLTNPGEFNLEYITEEGLNTILNTVGTDGAGKLQQWMFATVYDLRVAEKARLRKQITDLEKSNHELAALVAGMLPIVESSIAAKLRPTYEDVD